MAEIKYEPFIDARVFSYLMPELFQLYLSYVPDLFYFSFLEKTPDLKVVCKDATREPVDFPTPTPLQRAIQNSANIKLPGSDPILGQVDDDWDGRMGWVVDGLAEEAGMPCGDQMFGGPLFNVLVQGWNAGGYRPVLASQLFQHRPDHWVIKIRDNTSLDSEQQNGKNYLLRSEIMGTTAIFYRQMNEISWDPHKHRFRRTNLRYSSGPLTATIVTFLRGKVRVVQATCNPSDSYPVLTFTLRAFHDLSMSRYDVAKAQEIAKWILCPPDAPQDLPLRHKKA